MKAFIQLATKKCRGGEEEGEYGWKGREMDGRGNGCLYWLVERDHRMFKWIQQLNYESTPIGNMVTRIISSTERYHLMSITDTIVQFY